MIFFLLSGGAWTWQYTAINLKKNTDGTVRCDGRGRETSAADGTCELVRTSGRQWPCFGRSWLYENKKKSVHHFISHLTGVIRREYCSPVAITTHTTILDETARTAGDRTSAPTPMVQQQCKGRAR
jgi:hypothetical protein